MNIHVRSPIIQALDLGKLCQLVAESKGFYLFPANDGDNGDRAPWWQCSHDRLNFTSTVHEREETVWLQTCIENHILVADMGTLKRLFDVLKATEYQNQFID